jgi:hypothetical protein
MKFSRQFLLGMLALAMQAGFAWALDPVAGLPAAPEGAAPIATPPALPALCDTACAACCDSRHGGFFAGAGLYLIQPYFENNPAYNLISETSVPSGDAHLGKVTAIAVDRINVSQHINVAPLVWLGYECADGFGGRVRYWYLREGTSQSMSLPPFSGTAAFGPDGPVVVN